VPPTSAAMQYLCHSCAPARGHPRPAAPVALTVTSYQLGKYLKHTIQSSEAAYNTVFTLPASETYRDSLVETVAFGHLQIDDRGRRNLILVTPRQTGDALQGGHILGPTDGVKVVYPYDYNLIHGFPIRSSELLSPKCAACGKALGVDTFTGLPTS
jgi:hypothetical protein